MSVSAPELTHASAAAAYGSVSSFVRGVHYQDLPADVAKQAGRCVLDLIGVAAAGSRTPASAIVNAYASTQLVGRDRAARILFDGRRAGLAGAAFAGATTIDAFDAHDGHVLTKGHAGVAVLPALLAYLDGGVARPSRINGREFLTCVALGYEIATRAGIALHATAADYHCSGAWNALACAALGGRWLGFDDERMRHAIGIAEYWGPRGQILRVCSYPTMLKDGSGWGAQVGVSAALLAHDGFTGAPALTVEREDAHGYWSDLGTRWRMREQYFKAYPICRWAQPAVEAALTLKQSHRFGVGDIVTVGIESFREAIDLGSQCAAPIATDEAQYSLPYAVAAALVYGQLGAVEVSKAALVDPRITHLLQAIRLTDDAEFSRRFPSERWARVRITLRDGTTRVSEPARARGNPENPLSDDELREKYRTLAQPVLGARRTENIERLVDSLASDDAALSALTDELLHPVD
ncbi:MAG: MmgE/PrpD family protein [Burkholderiaceae bacterium]